MCNDSAIVVVLFWLFSGYGLTTASVLVTYSTVLGIVRSYTNS